ncbi:MAG: NAD-dependent epimerase/dehydratase family protein [Anaerolineae bacterium]|nr:NAD-dependent epimerase/dehydratase family protein [Anaerolineae bacterium]MBL6965246.1 NAD-dependent epimerase/dehydratase family protein [Anaerolineales bacterium]
MILVTGGTGFIGRALIRHLVEAGYQVRTLIRPSQSSPRLPKGVPVEVALAALSDERSLRAALVGVDTIYHLAGVERSGVEADLLDVDVRGTLTVLSAAANAGVDRFFYLSHLGADRASAYPIFKAKAIAEEHIRRSGLDATIMRTGIVFGPNDGFTTGLAQLLSAIPFFFLLPGDGSSLMQPIWVEDLVTCMVWALDENVTRNQTYELGGPEFLTLSDVLKTILAQLGIQRRIVPFSPPYMRALTVMVEYMLPNSPVSIYWLDYLAYNRTCSLDTIPRVFNLMPSRMSHQLGYLNERNWRRELFRSAFRRKQ